MSQSNLQASTLGLPANHALLPVGRRARDGRRAARDVDSSDTTSRLNNSVTYLSPNAVDARFNALALVGDSQNTTPSSVPSQFVGTVGLRLVF